MGLTVEVCAGVLLASGLGTPGVVATGEGAIDFTAWLNTAGFCVAAVVISLRSLRWSVTDCTVHEISPTREHRKRSVPHLRRNTAGIPRSTANLHLGRSAFLFGRIPVRGYVRGALSGGLALFEVGTAAGEKIGAFS